MHVRVYDVFVRRLCWTSEGDREDNLLSRKIVKGLARKREISINFPKASARGSVDRALVIPCLTEPGHKDPCDRVSSPMVVNRHQIVELYLR